MWDIRADPWIFLAFVLFVSSVVTVLVSFFFSLNRDALPGSWWWWLGLLLLRCIQRVKLLAERLGLLLQKVSEVPRCRRVLYTRSRALRCARCLLRRWSETGDFPPPSLHCWLPIPRLSVPGEGGSAGCDEGGVLHPRPPLRAGVDVQSSPPRPPPPAVPLSCRPARRAGERWRLTGKLQRGGISPCSIQTPLCTLHTPGSCW